MLEIVMADLDKIPAMRQFSHQMREAYNQRKWNCKEDDENGGNQHIHFVFFKHGKIKFSEDNQHY